MRAETQVNTFHLPDLGEGLPEAEIVSWHVKAGDPIEVDQPMVSVETAKAVVEVPAPYSGTVSQLHAAEGDIVETGKPLIDIEPSANPPAAAPKSSPAPPPSSDDAGTVVGRMPTSGAVLVEHAVAGNLASRSGGRVKAAPAARAVAKRLNIDLSVVPASGKHGQVTVADVEAFAPSQTAPATTPAIPRATGKLRGPRRAMAHSMSLSRDQVAGCTLFDDADIHAWPDRRDFTVRLLRAMVAACRAEPEFNAFFDPDTLEHRFEERVDIAIAVDTPDGLIVPVIRHAEQLDRTALKREVARLKQATRARTVEPAEMRDYTITLSNFGALAGRYATPLLVPPTVAILAAGKLQHDVVAVLGGIEVHRRIPLSLSFDHRCITGGEACRFIAAVITDLEQPD